MGMLDGLLGQLGGQVDIANLAEKVGLPREQVEQAIGALAQQHVEPGDTVQGAAAQTGLSPDVLQQIVGHIGGEGGLSQVAGMLQGGGAGDMLGKLGGMFGKG